MSASQQEIARPLPDAEREQDLRPVAPEARGAEAAFDRHAALPETSQFVERVQALIDQPFDVNWRQLLR